MGPPRAPCRPWLPCGALALLTCLFAFHGLLAAGPGGAGLPPALSGRLCWGHPCAGGKGCAGESAANDGPGGGGSAAAAQPAAPPAGPAAGEAGRPVGAGAAAGAEAGSPEAAAQPAGPGAAAGAAEGPAGASQAESEAKARADAEAEAKAAAEASAKANAEASAKADAEATAKVDAGATANSDTDATTKADVEANAKADAQAMAEAHAEGTDGVELKQPVAVGAGEEVNWPPDVPQVPDEDVALFRQNFRKILSWWHTPLPKPSAKVKLLIMVTTIPKEAKLREVHRETWMSLPGICILTNDVVQEPPGCSAFVAFFVGFDNKTDAYLRKEMSAQKDIVLLDTFDRWDFRPIPVKRPPRNWKGRKEGKVWVPSEHLAKPSFNGEVKGKVLKSFQYAWKNFPWVTHYAKNDMDNFPYVAEILEDLEDLPHSRAGIKSKDIMPTSNPTPWVEGHGVYYGRYQGRYFMQGQFYILSRPVLECIFKRTDVQACKGKPGEDAMVGCLVTNTYNVSRSSQAGLWWSRGGPCPEPWRLAVDSGQDQHGRSVARWCPCKPKQCPIGLGPLENFCRHEYPA